MKFFKRLAFAAIGLSALYAVIGVGLAVFGAYASPPAVMGSISTPARNQDIATLPTLTRYTTRDGAMLAYRGYAGRADRVIVLVHGSTGSSDGMHTLARKLAPAADGAGDQPTVYALDLRGHGANRPLGDVSYIGQLEDDLEDFAKDRTNTHPDARWSLVGFSSGGGFALRIAGQKSASRFVRIVALAPALHWQAPTAKPDGDLWAKPFIPRIIGQTMLYMIGVRAFEHMPALVFGRRDEKGQPYFYSFTMLNNFATGSDYPEKLRAAAKAPIVMVGEKDELFRAEAYAPHLKSIRPDISVTVLPGLGHMDMTYHPAALEAVAHVLRGG